MKQRGRVSAAAKEAEREAAKAGATNVVDINAKLGKNPPPSYLTREEAQLWRDVIAAKAPGWFTADNLPMLEEYVQAVTRSRRIHQWIGQLTSKKRMTAADNKRYGELERMSQRTTTTVRNLATAMRLTQQSRYQPKDPKNGESLGDGPALWEE